MRCQERMVINFYFHHDRSDGQQVAFEELRKLFHHIITERMERKYLLMAVNVHKSLSIGFRKIYASLSQQLCGDSGLYSLYNSGLALGKYKDPYGIQIVHLDNQLARSSCRLYPKDEKLAKS